MYFSKIFEIADINKGLFVGFFLLIRKWKHAYFLEISQKPYIWFGYFGKLLVHVFVFGLIFFNTSSLIKQANSVTVYAFWKLLCCAVYSNIAPVWVPFIQMPFINTALKSRFFFEHHFNTASFYVRSISCHTCYILRMVPL